MPRKYFRKARFPDWFLTVKHTVAQFTGPLILFQVIRTLLFPSVVDFFILFILVILHFCFVNDIL